MSLIFLPLIQLALAGAFLASAQALPKTPRAGLRIGGATFMITGGVQLAVLAPLTLSVGLVGLAVMAEILSAAGGAGIHQRAMADLTSRS